MPRQQEGETVVIDHHPRNRQPQEHPEVGIVIMMTMRMKDRKNEEGTRDLQEKERDRKKIRRRRRPLGMNYNSRALGKAIGETTKRPAQPPPEYEHAKHQDVRFWLTACKDFFDRNPYQRQNEADRIKYALSKLKGPQVSAFAMTYRNQMTGELGYTRQEGYEL